MTAVLAVLRSRLFIKAILTVAAILVDAIAGARDRQT
jgi:hypothetical protein